VAATTREIGYDGIELQIRNPRQYDARHLRNVADGEGLEFCAIATGMEYIFNKLSLISDDASVRDAAVRRLQEHMELAAVIGGPVIVGTMRGNIPDVSQTEKCLGYYRDCLSRLDNLAAGMGVPLVVEGITRYISNYLNDIVETADFLDTLGLRQTTLHIDTHSMNIEDVDMAANIGRCAGRIGYVHYSDSNRTYPGGGHIDFAAIHSALIRAKYQGYITVECTPEPDEREAARLGFEYMRAL
jgi:sugar phosphate isomerase/epimerase